MCQVIYQFLLKIFLKVIKLIERILLLMQKNNIKAKTLTEILNLSHTAITDWSKGKSKPGTDAVIKIANYFEVTTDWILTGKENSSVLTDFAEDEIELIELWRSLTERQKGRVEQFIYTITNNPEGLEIEREANASAS
jgi:transcriptional regulator with XRE-family HTH domain